LNENQIANHTSKDEPSVSSPIERHNAYRECFEILDIEQYEAPLDVQPDEIVNNKDDMILEISELDAEMDTLARKLAENAIRASTFSSFESMF
jgi:hypothetical protein